jgi:hypothetical protein
MQIKNSSSKDAQLLDFYDRVRKLQTPGYKLCFEDDRIGRFLSGLFLTCFHKNEGDTRMFLKAYVKFSTNRLSAIFKMQTMNVLYKAWKKDPNFFRCLNEFAEKFNKTSLPENIWDEVIFYYGKKKIDDFDCELHLLLLEQIIDMALKNKIEMSDLPLLIFRQIQFYKPIHCKYDVPPKMNESNVNNIIITAALYLALFQSDYKDSKKMLSFILKFRFNYNDSLFPIQKDKILSFANQLLNKVNMSFVTHADMNALKGLYLVYEKNPSLFKSFDIKNREINSQEEWIKLLFTSFKVPEFIIWNVFLRANLLPVKHILWCAEIIGGESPRNQAMAPFKVSKKMAGLLFHIDDKSIPIHNALIHATLMSKGMDYDSAYQLSNSLDNIKELDTFIEIVISLHNRKIDAYEISVFWDYLLDLKRREEGWPDVRKLSERAISKIIREWMLITKRVENIQLPKSKIKNFEMTLDDNKTVVVKQVATAIDLYMEGKAMRHCVYRYLSRIIYTDTYIFSLALKQEIGRKRILTIEVKDNVVMQVAGYANRKPTRSELKWVQFWAEFASLEVDKWT